MQFFDDGPEKPVLIWSRVGRRPVFAGGNSNGDVPMLRFANVAGRKSFRLLVRHDDAEREGVANEGMSFTDSYGEQSCTAGRSSFITGQSVYRTGLSKVGIPAAPVGLEPETVTIADVLKEQGYATGQFGKNHLGDLNKYLPTVHGFDEFFGNLYHLNAEE